MDDSLANIDQALTADNCVLDRGILEQRSGYRAATTTYCQVGMLRLMAFPV